MKCGNIIIYQCCITNFQQNTGRNQQVRIQRCVSPVYGSIGTENEMLNNSLNCVGRQSMSLER